MNARYRIILSLGGSEREGKGEYEYWPPWYVVGVGAGGEGKGKGKEKEKEKEKQKEKHEN